MTTLGNPPLVGKARFSWMKSTWTILAGILIGIGIGMFQPDWARQLVPFGDLYLAFLKMCVIPIMISAIVSSLGRLLMSHETARYLKRMLTVFTLALLIVSAVGLLVGSIARPGEMLSDHARATLGEVLADSESGVSHTAGQAAESPSVPQTGFVAFVLKLIPSNIFVSLVEGNSLQILFFSIIVGITLGLVRSESSEPLLSAIELVFKLFQKAIAWSMYVLPLGLMCIMAGQVASTGADLLVAMIYFIALIYAACLLLMGISAVVISRKSRMPFWRSILLLKQTLIIAFGTRNSIATMPTMLDSLRNHFKLDSKSANLVVPLGIVICRHSMVLLFAMAIVFASQLYYVPLGVSGLLVALFGAVLAAVAGAGAPGVVSLSMLSLVAVPLGIPYEAVVILLLAVNPVIDPMITMANVHINCATAVVIADQSLSSAETAAIEQSVNQTATVSS